VTKYKETVQKMVSENSVLFTNFKNIHDRYGLHLDTNLQEEFNTIGKEVMKVIREYENKLCGRSESNGYASYSGNLAQKFMDEIRKLFPHIDRVGIIVTKKAVVDSFAIPNISPNKKSNEFNLKKLI
jgi:hypothetical protein